MKCVYHVKIRKVPFHIIHFNNSMYVYVHVCMVHVYMQLYIHLIVKFYTLRFAQANTPCLLCCLCNIQVRDIMEAKSEVKKTSGVSALKIEQVSGSVSTESPPEGIFYLQGNVV